jgi:2-polyprenyl-6-methoxyphenol hydroxylase-like FAD-dependent oxidoreductase
MTLRIACVGGGPGGLFFSTLLKRQLPDAEVHLFERNQATDAFGFGVVFSDATLNAIDAADPVLRDGLRDHGKHWDDIEVWAKDEKRSFAGNGMAAINRRVLLPLLQQRASEVGVELHFGANAPSTAELRDQFDVVVGADGANSRTRTDILDGLGHTVEAATAKFIWFGTTHRFNGLTFIHRKSPHGNFAVHAYPISDELSTFIVETDEETWLRAGLNSFDTTQPPGPSDEKTREFLEELFRDDIGEDRIVANNSRWATFQTRRTQTWHQENVVLLGDAVHTAHFSVGSGTKMAMEDAIVLAREIAAHSSDLATAFENYEQERAPRVKKIQDSARGGLSWWEHFGRYYDAFEPTQFAFHFFSRSIGIDKIEIRDPQLADAARNSWVQTHGSSALKTPLEIGGVRFASRLLSLEIEDGVPTRLSDGAGASLPISVLSSASSDAAVLLQATDAADESSAQAKAAAQAGVLAAVIQRGSALDRVLLAEELRLAHGIVAVIVNDDDENAAETLLLSGRADAVAVSAVSAVDAPVKEFSRG